MYEERCVNRLNERIEKAIKRGNTRKALRLTVERDEIRATYEQVCPE